MIGSHRIILWVLALLPLPGIAQRFSVGGEIQMGTYAMSDMKEFQDAAGGYFTYPMDKVSSFPPWLGVKLQGLYAINDFASVGVYTGFNSTGGRLYQEDYSGSVTLDILCRGISIGIMGEYHLQNLGPYNLRASLAIGAIVGTAELTSKLDFTGQQPQNTSRSYSGTNISIAPGLTLRRTFSKIILWSQLSYVGEISAGNLTSDTGVTISSGGQNVTMGWQGVRLGIGVGYLFGKAKE